MPPWPSRCPSFFSCVFVCTCAVLCCAVLRRGTPHRQGVTIPSQRRYVRYWGQLCGRIRPFQTVEAADVAPPRPSKDDTKRLTEVLMDRENKAKLQEIGTRCVCSSVCVCRTLVLFCAD